jgi:hypothetical protein
MEIPQLSDLELKTLKLFTYYCASFGADSVYRQYYLQDCRHDWDEGNWSSPQTRVNIESYDKIDELIDKLINDDSLINNFTDCEGSQQITIDIDCKKRILEISLSEIHYGSEPHSLSYDLEDIKESYSEVTYNEVSEIFQNLDGSEGQVDFSGSGDDGYIEDFMVINNDSVPLTAGIEDMLYSMLNGNFAGWENNEGAQGSFVFDSNDRTIYFEFNYNTEEWYNVDLDYQINF